jgi:N-acetylmuramoyl-L-alanine amidase CwlA
MTSWRDIGPVPFDVWNATILDADGPGQLAARSSWDAAGEHSALALAMLKAESSYGTDFNANTRENLNPLNLRPPSGDGYMAYQSYPAAIRAWRERLTSIAYKNGIYERTETLDELIHVYAPGSDNNDEAAYVATIERLFDHWGIAPKGEPMAIVAKECPVEIAVLTGDAPNRPALPMPSPSWVTVHEVGNTSPGADEDMHRDFVHNGGGAAQVSFHFVVGPTKAIQLIYLNENAWHASDGFNGTGNRDSIAIETIQIGDFDTTLSHLSWLIAELFRNPKRFAFRTDVAVIDDLPSDDARNRIKQHNHWAPDKKNCPQFIRERGLWLPLLNAVDAELHGSDAPGYATPEPVPWKKGDTGMTKLGDAGVYLVTAQVKAIRDTQPRKYASGKAERTGPEIKVGKSVVVTASLTVPNGKRKEHWYTREDGSRLSAAAFTPKLPQV